MFFPKKVKIKEVGLRDGLQNEKVILSTEKKISLLDEIVDSGVKEVDLGSFVRNDVMPAMADTSDMVKYFNSHPEKYEGVDYSCLVPNMKGLDRAIECGCRAVRIGVSASRVHAKRNYNRTPEESIAAFEGIFTKAIENNIDIKGTVQMAFGSPWEGSTPVETVIAIVEHYERFNIKKVGLADTGSMANPRGVYDTLCRLQERFPDIEFNTHFHNARGLALANDIAAMEAGLTLFDGSFAGLGGCPFVPDAAGNPATEDVVNMFNEMGVETGVDIEKTISISLKVEQLVGHEAVGSLIRADTCSNLIKKMSIKA